MRNVSALVEAVQRGNMQAFGELVSRFQDMAYGYAYSVLGDFSLAQDTAQDAFVEAYRSLHTLKDPAAFPGWFKRIVRYRCSRSIRSARKQQVPLDENDIPSGEPGPDAAAERAQVRQRVLDAVRKLSAPLREVTTLYYMNGYSQQEVSEFLEVPVGTVKSRLNASRAQLKERLGDMVRKALDEHKLPDDFTGRIVEGVPHLAWDRSGNTSYIAAVEAALAPTDRALDYDTLMVYSGLAFRLRYIRSTQKREWSTLGPVGFYDRAADVVNRAIGCTCRPVRYPPKPPEERADDVAEMKRRTVKAIDSGLCPIAYIHGPLGVVYGYENNAERIMVRCYEMEGQYQTMTFDELLDSCLGQTGPFFFEKVAEPLPPREAVIHGLSTGLLNWLRPNVDVGWWGHWCFGDAAYGELLQDLRAADEYTVEEAAQFQRVYSGTVYVLYDARLAAARYLETHADILAEKATPILKEVAKLCRTIGESIRSLRDKGEAFLVSDSRPLGWTSGGGRFQTGDARPFGWASDSMRRRELEVLEQARELDGQVAAKINHALVEAHW
ncbi:MAG: sigma-70 family RNA polymerase sigma factor [Chitinivibrionales bacterium]|nr:sigma-70 family RNA polymerase sigma factor [Chitinivibrionales bacterium]